MTAKPWQCDLIIYLVKMAGKRSLYCFTSVTSNPVLIVALISRWGSAQLNCSQKCGAISTVWTVCLKCCKKQTLRRRVNQCSAGRVCGAGHLNKADCTTVSYRCCKSAIQPNDFLQRPPVKMKNAKITSYKHGFWLCAKGIVLEKDPAEVVRLSFWVESYLWMGGSHGLGNWNQLNLRVMWVMLEAWLCF